ncbi:HNH endonuclease [Cupriavidus gilardii]|uniref:HNH endonuclease signature motif containing protein n=1 Tax=Cupriavidus gilardii TaxID=82541 RepID=UPI0021B2E7BD|nr:HNH endonuclease signature motif containing protein [Cupriavidus gilardii]UXC37654.1 HNH endonuclease [Cupriavidus gilardii]
MKTLQDLKPTTLQRVRDITDRLGITMTTQYDWCFSNSDGTYLVNIWHDHMLEANGEIFFIDRASEWAADNMETATPVQLNRADAVSALILKAYYQKAPLHVAILDGVRRKVGLRETSEAYQRELDHVCWYPHHRDDEGRIHVIRGKAQPAAFNPREEDLRREERKRRPIPASSEKAEVTKTAVFERDSEVVKAAKRRAADGRCEFCGKEGFRTTSDGFYLEAHHVIPLNCRGADDVRNVVAICADDHRRAHFGKDRHEFRDRLIWEVLAPKYPGDTGFFELMDEKSRQIARSEAGNRSLEDHKVDS